MRRASRTRGETMRAVKRMLLILIGAVSGVLLYVQPSERLTYDTAILVCGLMVIDNIWQAARLDEADK